ncbi:MAG: hypothetical protein J6Y35_07130 [Bacteroidales bacterium]|nr:hypothetical protein [Bacteroidales bacterium]
MHSNSQILAAVIANWAKPLVDQVLVARIGALPPITAASEWVKKYFPVAGNYSIVNDIAFLAVPATEIIIEPMVINGIAKLGVSDEQIPEYAAKLVDAMLAEAKKNGKVTLFNTIELEKSDFEKLKKLLDKNLPATADEKYTVIE